MIQLQQVTLHRGVKILLEKADLTLHAGQKVGIIGENGAGKTSLFKLLLGELECDHGEVQAPKQLKWAHIRQEVPGSDENAVDYVLQGDAELYAYLTQLKIAEQAQDGMAIAHLHAKLAELDGYAATSKASKILLGLGFTQAQLLMTVREFSGGWRMRLNLAQVLISRADILLLDEPTNHLDLEGIMWLEEWLRESKQSILVISHDREFLDQFATHIVNFAEHKLTLFTGNYSTFEKTYSEQLAVQQAAFIKQQKSRAHLQNFVDRFRAKATKAKQAQSRLKMLEKMVLVSAVREKNPFRFSIDTVQPGGNPMLHLSDVAIGYEQKTILSHVNFSLRDGDRVGLLGLNGAGKSTFIKFLDGSLPAQSGHVVKSEKLAIGYFAQHQLDQLDPESGPLHHLLRLDAAIREADARRFLGGFLFFGDRVFDPVRNFSGGEKARLALALLVWQKPNCLLLDEPTNHLDMDMREALSFALQNYSGAIVLVSHDRYLLQTLIDEFWLVENGKVQRFDGDLDDYRQRVLTDEHKAEDELIIKPKKSQKQLRETSKLEEQLSRLEKKKQDAEQKLADEKLYQADQAEQLRQLQKELRQIQEKIADIEEQILALWD